MISEAEASPGSNPGGGLLYRGDTMTKLERARDATLAKYDGLLRDALWGEKDFNLYAGNCVFCSVFLSHVSVCLPCPILGAERIHDSFGHCNDILYKLNRMIDAGDSIPAILAAMIYLWGFED